MNASHVNEDNKDNPFDPEEDEILESAATQVPPRIEDHTQITVEDVERMTPDELERVC